MPRMSDISGVMHCRLDIIRESIKQRLDWKSEMTGRKVNWTFYSAHEERWLADFTALLVVASGVTRFARVRTSVKKGNPFPFAVYIIID